jgi:oligoendopeptidase F
MEEEEKDPEEGTQADPNSEKPQAGAGEGTGSGDQGSKSQADGKPRSISIDKYQKVQSEAKNLRERLRKYEEKDNEGLTPEQRIEKKAKALEDRERELSRREMSAQVAKIARKMNALDEDVIAALIPVDTEADDLEEAVQKIRKAKPHLFRGAGKADGGAGGKGPGSDDMNYLIRHAAGRA